MSDRRELLAERERVSRELAEAKAALPYHSVRPWQWQRVEDLEEKLAELDKALAEGT